MRKNTTMKMSEYIADCTRAFRDFVLVLLRRLSCLNNTVTIKIRRDNRIMQLLVIHADYYIYTSYIMLPPNFRSGKGEGAAMEQGGATREQGRAEREQRDKLGFSTGAKRWHPSVTYCT